MRASETGGANAEPRRYFHIFDKDRRIKYQGRVVEQIEPGIYMVQLLVELFGWVADQSSTLHIFRLADMAVTVNGTRTEGAWQFYESQQHMISWYEDYRKEVMMMPGR
jgi:hypothetical protein